MMYILASMEASLKNFIDQLTNHCRQDGGQSVWDNDGTGLSFRLSEQRSQWAINAVADVAAAGMMIAEICWSVVQRA